ncbi:MAG: hypothetical protein IJ706_07130 [Clostridia bacterium]|nr:hypothetical protein [Clostridia bacterium]MBR1677061.1 hypothetical protein [Clostridia bacterium]
MEYKVYCLTKHGDDKVDDKVVRVKVNADSISDALKKAKELFMAKLKKSFNIFMYETNY